MKYYLLFIMCKNIPLLFLQSLINILCQLRELQILTTMLITTYKSRDVSSCLEYALLNFFIKILQYRTTYLKKSTCIGSFYLESEGNKPSTITNKSTTTLSR